MYVHDLSVAAQIAERREAELRRKYYRRLTGFRFTNLPIPFASGAGEVNQKPEIRVDSIELLETWAVDSEVLGEGYLDKAIGHSGPDDYAIDINRAHIDPGRSTFTIAVTLGLAGDAQWDRDSVRVTANPNGRWMIVDTVTGVPAVRRNFPDVVTAKVWLNVKARDMSKINAPLKIFAGANYISLYRSDGRVGISTPPLTRTINLRLISGQANINVRPIP
jgi:hypothetical protein